jgi:hypothetical protein
VSLTELEKLPNEHRKGLASRNGTISMRSNYRLVSLLEQEAKSRELKAAMSLRLPRYALFFLIHHFMHFFSICGVALYVASILSPAARFFSQLIQLHILNNL